MLWYNNPNAVTEIHEHMVRSAVEAATKRRMLRLIPAREGH